MDRVQLLRAQRIGRKLDWRLDWHSAKYIGLHDQAFTTRPYTVTQDKAGRADLVALDVYGDPAYAIPLLLFNRIIDPVSEISMGATLLIPDFAELDGYLRSFSNQSQVGSTAVNTFVEV